MEGFERVAADGVAGQVMQGKGSSGETSEEEWRVLLDVDEQRGFGSPRRVISVGSLGDSGDSVGRQAMGGGTSKRRRRNWVKTKQVRNYAVGDDLTWDCVLKMAKCTLVGRVMGRNFAKKTIQD